MKRGKDIRSHYFGLQHKFQTSQSIIPEKSHPETLKSSTTKRKCSLPEVFDCHGYLKSRRGAKRNETKTLPRIPSVS
jgi:hypothetical protein